MDVLEKTAEKNVDIEQEKPRRVLFVCTGNTCRSPMAEAAANAMAQERAERLLPKEMASMAAPILEAFSAGLYPHEGEPISAQAVLALEHQGIVAVQGHDFHKHTAKSVEHTDAESFDLLVGMSPSHAMELLMRFPQLAGRIVTMPSPIPDPYGGSVALYEETLRQIKAGIAQLLFSEERTT